MKNFIRLILSAMIALPFIQPAMAQTSEPGDTKPLPAIEKSLATTDGIIVKFRVLEQSSSPAPSPNMPQSQATAQAVAATAMQAMSNAAGVSLAYDHAMSGGLHVLRLPSPVTQQQAQAIADNIAQLPLVEYASPVIHMQAMSMPADADVVPNDPQYPSQWHYFAPTSDNYGINLPAAWSVTTGSTNVVVAVLDTGIRFDHPDLAGRTLAGYDMISSITIANDGNARDPDPTDVGDYVVSGDKCYSPPPYPPAYNYSSWHGTHVAGTIGAATNNGVGVAGVNWNSKLLPVRVLGKCGNDDPDIIDAVRWAAGIPIAGVPDNPTPARVINLSLGGSGNCTAAWQSAINEVIAKGVVVVVAAGNSNNDASFMTPANCNGVIAVGATLRNGKRASYSSYGATVKISAPGGTCASSCTLTDVDGVLSTYNAGTTTPSTNTYNYLDGTSMATPHVAGVVSLMFSVNPFLSPAQVLSILQNTATPFPDGACDANPSRTCGAGIVNAGAAVALAKSALNVSPRAYLPIATRQLFVSQLVNGDFESGPVNWQATSIANPNDPLIYQKGDSPFPASITPHSGKWLAWMGGYQPGVAEDAKLSQEVNVQASARYLVYYQIVYGGETNCNNDYVRVLVNNNEVNGSRTGVCNAPTYGGWMRRSLDLNAYAGKQVTLTFNFHADGSDNTPASSVFIDDVGFSATP